ncbi:MAG: hypothetical protein AAGI46_04640 [Planctomycetota bacterium]
MKTVFPISLRDSFFGTMTPNYVLPPSLIFETRFDFLYHACSSPSNLRYIGLRSAHSKIDGVSLLEDYCIDATLDYTDNDGFLVAGELAIPPDLIIQNFVSRSDDDFDEWIVESSRHLVENSCIILPLGPDGSYSVVIWPDASSTERCLDRLSAAGKADAAMFVECD